MASVQHSQVPHGPGMGLPQNINQQMLQEVYQKYKQMKESGVRPDDPEFLKAHNLLSAVTQQQNFAKQRQEAQRRQQQQQQQLNQANGIAVDTGANGVNGRPAPHQDGPASTSSNAPTSAQASHPTSASSPSGQKPPTGASIAFTPEQLNTLRTQIYAFKLLSRNLQLPAQVQQKLFTSRLQPATAQAPSTTMAQASQSGVQPQGKDEEAAPVSAPVKTMYETFVDPLELLPESMSYADHSIRAKRPRIPALMPIGVDVEQVREDRERIINNRINARKQELAALSVNTGVWDTSKSDAPTGDDSIKLKALIEYKMLCLLPKQRAFRQQIGQDLYNYDNLAMTANRSQHRRMKKQSLREARITEKLEKQQRDARESKERKKQTEFFDSVRHHGAEIKESGRTNKSRSQKLGRMMQTHHINMEKEEQKRIERNAKQRLQALKANDEETYLKLLGQAKDTRISHLLQQTNGFLKQLATSVRQQQRNALTQYGREEHDDLPEEDDEEDDDDDEDGEGGGRKGVDYYAVAHRIKEEVFEQPKLLIGGQLKEYQLKGLQWMISLYNNNLNGILADEMGLGKTIQTISLVTYLIERKRQNGPFLVIVPLSTLTNWSLEFDKWAPDVTVVKYRGGPNERKRIQGVMRSQLFQVLLTTYEYIIKDRPFLSKIKWVHMIVDEGHRMKNANSKLSATLTSYYTTRYRLILTGTPLQNNLPELWALLNFVLPKIFKSVKSFDEWFNTPFANTGGQDKMELTEEEQLLVIRRLHKVLRPFLLRRLKKDVEKDLPDKQERVVKVRFSALQTKLYKQLVTHNRLTVSDNKGGKLAMKGLSNILMQLRKLCNHPYVFEAVENAISPSTMTNDLLWRTAGKFELLDRVLPKFQASGHRVLIFFQMTAIMDIMEDYLRYRGTTFLRLDGTTKSEDRADLLAEFNAPESPIFCFLLSTRAGGLGLNLQTADTVIIYDSDWNPHQDLQAQDRAHRIGQKNEVRILRLISSNSVEEKILERAQFKLDMDGKVIQAGKFDNKSTEGEREALLRTLLETAENADSLNDQAEMDDDDLNEIMARSEDELAMFQRMDAERVTSGEYGNPGQLPRLMAENELPDIYLTEDVPQEEIIEIAGRGARERKAIRYDDGLTEEQFAAAVEAEDDSVEAATLRKQAAIDRRRSKKEKRMRKAQGAIESSPEPDSGAGSESPQPKKRGRKSNPLKRKTEEPVDDSASKRKRGKLSKTSDAVSNSQRSTLQKALKYVVARITDLQVELPPSSDDSDASGPIMIKIIAPFEKVVSRAHYPDYFTLIQNPIAMDMIKKKINKEEYQSLRDLADDIKLMCNNCRTYNDDYSDIFGWANRIAETCINEVKGQIEAHPELGDLDDDAGSSMLDTAAASSVGTPLASNAPSTISGGPKLKLKFNTTRETTSATNGTGTDSAMLSDDED